jgi:hypothetical protein
MMASRLLRLRLASATTWKRWFARMYTDAAATSVTQHNRWPTGSNGRSANLQRLRLGSVAVALPALGGELDLGDLSAGQASSVRDLLPHSARGSCLVNRCLKLVARGIELCLLLCKRSVFTFHAAEELPDIRQARSSRP